MKKITTFIPTRGYGYSFIGGGFPSLVQTIDENTISTLLVLLSDEIKIDGSWRYPFYDFDCEDAIEYRIFDELVSQKIVTEVSMSKLLKKSGYKEYFPIIVSKCCKLYLEFLDEKPKDINYERIDEDIDYAVELLSDNGFTQMDFVYLYDAVISYSVSGVLCSRIYDTYGSLRYFHRIVQYSDNKFSSENNMETVRDWAFNITSQAMPKAPLFLSKSNYDARVMSPLERIGMRFVKKPTKTNSDYSSSLYQFEKILKLRDSDTFKELRKEYGNIISKLDKSKEIVQLPSFEDINTLWGQVKIDYAKSLKVSNILEKWTDYITIPAFLAGFVCPPVSAIPLVTWAGSKIHKGMVRKDFSDKYPWFFIKEQLSNIECEYYDKNISEGKGKRDKYTKK